MLSKIVSWFPMLLVTLFAVTAYWLIHHFKTDTDRSAVIGHEPDYIVRQFRVRRFDNMGFLANTLYGKTIVHYADDSTAHITSPAIFHQKAPDLPSYTITAKQGSVNQITREVAMMGTVNVVQKQTSQPDLTVQTPYVIYHDKTGIIETSQGLKLRQHSTQLTAQQLTIDTRANTFQLRGNVNGTFYPYQE